MNRSEVPGNLGVQDGALIASALRDLVAFQDEVMIEMEEMRSGLADEGGEMVDADLAGLRHERDRLHARIESWQPFTDRSGWRGRILRARRGPRTEVPAPSSSWTLAAAPRAGLVTALPRALPAPLRG